MARHRPGLQVSKWEAHIREREVRHSGMGSRSLAFSTQHSAFSTRHSACEGRCWNEKLQRLTGLAQGQSPTLASYRITSTFPKQEMYGLTSQVRRWAASVAANIAGGMRQAWERRILPVYQHSLGVGRRTRISLPAGTRSAAKKAIGI